MAQRVNLSPLGLPIRLKTFTAKEEAVTREGWIKAPDASGAWAKAPSAGGDWSQPPSLSSSWKVH